MKSSWIIIVLIAIGCSNDEDVRYKSHGEFLIKTGQACGWCGGADTLVVTQEMLQYHFWAACDEPDDKQREDNNSTRQWDDLLSALDYETFVEIDVNTCQLCVDGCDTWISVQKYDMEPHVIRFVESSPEIAPIRAFVNKLHTLHMEYRNN